MSALKIRSLAAILSAMTLLTSTAQAQFARPPEDSAPPDEPYVDAGSRYEDDRPPVRSTARLHVGPAVLASPATPGLFVALDVGRRAVGARFSGAWLGAEKEGGLAQYGGELWVDFAGGSQLHPIVGAGAALVRTEQEGDDESAGAGMLRGALEYELPVSDADARVGLSLVALVPAIGSDRDEPWVIGALTVGAGI